MTKTRGETLTLTMLRTLNLKREHRDVVGSTQLSTFSVWHVIIHITFPVIDPVTHVYISDD